MKKITCITLFSSMASILWGQNFSESTFSKRRELFAKEVRSGVAIIPSTMTNGNLNKNFYYLTGIDKPEYVLCTSNN